ncbi:MAG: molybdenum cofactor guanylyltransferase [Planctomycetes bacterium]|nr:molybdenum cofactor guanylyltransferase [Planctomycetota bacterium]
MNSDLTVIIVCGGRGRRMGGEKALLPFGAGTLLDHVVSRMRAGGDRVILSARRSTDFPGVADLVVGDPTPDEGPLGGLIRAIGAAGPDGAIVVAVDQPWADVALARAMMASRRRLGASALCYRTAAGIEPFHASYGPDAVAPLQAAWERGERRLQRAVESLHPVEIDDSALAPEFPPSRVRRALSNLNTPEDLAQARTLLAADSAR